MNETNEVEPRRDVAEGGRVRDTAYRQHPVAVGKEWAAVSCQDHAAGAWPMVGIMPLGVVTAHTIPVEDRLDIPWKIKNLRNAGD